MTSDKFVMTLVVIRTKSLDSSLSSRSSSRESIPRWTTTLKVSNLSLVERKDLLLVRALDTERCGGGEARGVPGAGPGLLQTGGETRTSPAPATVLPPVQSLLARSYQTLREIQRREISFQILCSIS